MNREENFLAARPCSGKGDSGGNFFGDGHTFSLHLRGKSVEDGRFRRWKMSDIKSPIEEAYWSAVSNRLFSMVYSALNGAGSPRELKLFRKEWTERGCYQLAELLIQCGRPDWAEYPEAFWVDPWIGGHLQAYRRDPAALCYILNKWLENEPLPFDVDEDPYVEERKIRDLEKLYKALNR